MLDALALLSDLLSLLLALSTLVVVPVGLFAVVGATLFSLYHWIARMRDRLDFIPRGTVWGRLGLGGLYGAWILALVILLGEMVEAPGDPKGINQLFTLVTMGIPGLGAAAALGAAFMWELRRPDGAFAGTRRVLE